jgi:hypothetical protein
MSSDDPPPLNLYEFIQLIITSPDDLKINGLMTDDEKNIIKNNIGVLKQSLLKKKLEKIKIDYTKNYKKEDIPFIDVLFQSDIQQKLKSTIVGILNKTMQKINNAEGGSKKRNKKKTIKRRSSLRKKRSRRR